ncbi:hypothetical protein E3N88_45106 [Mikania micrantha]|uniref:Uncharacterized protein n=1 Tax=Mikania micrantha TaxID=192012 RepID=A0A5N6LAC5_9ASTR|nr:hypothetical protein E3N88_45106 [Mikania micrantha]
MFTLRSKKQKVVALSSAEAEFRVDRHFIKDKLEAWKIKLPFVPSKDQLADILTKAVNGRVLGNYLGKLCFGNPTIQLEGEC